MPWQVAILATGNPNASVTHSFNSDLVFKLTSPEGTTIFLIANRGGSGRNFCTVLLDDDGGFPPASTMPGTGGGVTGNFAPESPLSAFDGENPNGNWTLNVVDEASLDTGTLNRFSLIIRPSICCPSGPTPTPGGTPSPTPTTTPAATPTPTTTVTPSPTSTPSPNPTSTPSGTPSPAPTPATPTPTTDTCTFSYSNIHTHTHTYSFGC